MLLSGRNQMAPLRDAHYVSTHAPQRASTFRAWRRGGANPNAAQPALKGTYASTPCGTTYPARGISERSRGPVITVVTTAITTSMVKTFWGMNPKS